MIRILRVLTLVFLLSSVAAGVMAFRHRQLSLDENLGQLGRYQFSSADGSTVSSVDLKGKTLVLACFFTCCTESCPQLSGSLARLQSELADVPDVRLVSLTVDPHTDTPPKLDEYAKAFGAKPDRWVFLTGPKAEVEAFVLGQLHLGVEENKVNSTPGNKMLHSNKLVLIDANSVIRGYFDGTDPNEVDKLRDAVRKLAGR